jgi:hypothetical protein
MLEDSIGPLALKRRQSPSTSYDLTPHPTLVSGSLNNGSNPSGVASETKPGDVPVASEGDKETTATGTDAERGDANTGEPTSEPDVTQKGEQNADSGDSGEKKEGEKEDEKEGEKKDEKKDEPPVEKAVEKEDEGKDEPQAEKKDEPQPESTETESKETNGATKEEEAQVGEKRKADESAEPEKAADTEEPETKKQKPSNGTAATNGTKRGPGRPKASAGGEKNASATKKEKKVPRTGTSQRKTRSQGSAPEPGL